MQWTDFSNLTNAQRTKLAEFAVIGAALTGPTSNPSTAGVTYSQAKTARAFAKEVQTLVGPALAGALFVIKKTQEQAVTDFDTANP